MLVYLFEILGESLSVISVPLSGDLKRVEIQIVDAQDFGLGRPQEPERVEVLALLIGLLGVHCHVARTIYLVALSVLVVLFRVHSKHFSEELGSRMCAILVLSFFVFEVDEVLEEGELVDDLLHIDG